jgi:hypothetical protein
MRSRPSGALLRALPAALLAMTVTLLGVSSPAEAETEYRKGPDPTEATVTAPLGPFATASVSVPSSVAGFGGGDIHYPTDTSQGTFGAVAVAPVARLRRVPHQHQLTDRPATQPR